MKEHFSIAIDGPGGAGKSSLAKAVAKKLSILHVDTGAIYRTIGYAAFARGLNAKDESQIAPLLKTIRIDMAFDEAGRQKMLLDGKDVSRGSEDLPDGFRRGESAPPLSGAFRARHARAL